MDTPSDQSKDPQLGAHGSVSDPRFKNAPAARGSVAPRDSLVVFEDHLAERVGPVALNRPTFELILGAASLRQRIERAARRPVQAAWVRQALRPLLDPFRLADAAEEPYTEALWINAALGAEGGSFDWRRALALAPGEALTTPEGRVLACRLRPGDAPVEALPLADAGAPASAAEHYRHELAAEVRCLEHGWELIGWHTEALAEDVRLMAAAAHTQVVVEESARIEEPVFVDTRGGPVVVRAGASVAAFSRLEGPLLVDHEARVLGGRIAGSYIGPCCRVRGEVESTVLLGWSNKAHDGFVGHSYLGCWVNLGALTTTSDLKNNYGAVRMSENGELCDTGFVKVGSLLADHVKTAIGTLLGAGTVIGLGSNVFGAAGFAPRWIPPYAWGVGPGAQAYDWERFLATAERVCRRRDWTLSPAERETLRRAFELSAQQREGWLAEQKATPHV